MQTTIRGCVLIVCMLLSAVACFAAHYQGSQVVTQGGYPVVYPTIRVCSEPATGTSCTPLASIYSNPGLTTPLSNPFMGDSLGNFGFYAPNGIYHIQVSGLGINTFDIPYASLSDLAGSGTTNTLTKWISPTTPGDSNVTEAGGTLAVGDNLLQVPLAGLICWSTDTCMSRLVIGGGPSSIDPDVAFGNGTPGDFSGGIKLAKVDFADGTSQTSAAGPITCSANNFVSTVGQTSACSPGGASIFVYIPWSLTPVFDAANASSVTFEMYNAVGRNITSSTLINTKPGQLITFDLIDVGNVGWPTNMLNATEPPLGGGPTEDRFRMVQTFVIDDSNDALAIGPAAIYVYNNYAPKPIVPLTPIKVGTITVDQSSAIRFTHLYGGVGQIETIKGVQNDEITIDNGSGIDAGPAMVALGKESSVCTNIDGCSFIHFNANAGQASLAVGNNDLFMATTPASRTFGFDLHGNFSIDNAAARARFSTGTTLDLAGSIPMATELKNDSTTPAVAGHPVKINGSPSPITAAITTTTDTSGILGIATSNTNLTGGVIPIAVAGQASCVFDGSGCTSGHYVVNSTVTGGRCQDAGASKPTGVTILGRCVQNISGNATGTVLMVQDNATTNTMVIKTQTFGATCPAHASGATCTVQYFWTTPFADANYTAVCWGGYVAGISSGIPIISWLGQDASSITLFVQSANDSPSGAGLFGNVSCIAIHQ